MKPLIAIALLLTTSLCSGQESTTISRNSLANLLSIADSARWYFRPQIADLKTLIASKDSAFAAEMAIKKQRSKEWFALQDQLKAQERIAAKDAAQVAEKERLLVIAARDVKKAKRGQRLIAGVGMIAVFATGFIFSR